MDWLVLVLLAAAAAVLTYATVRHKTDLQAGAGLTAVAVAIILVVVSGSAPSESIVARLLDLFLNPIKVLGAHGEVIGLGPTLLLVGAGALM